MFLKLIFLFQLIKSVDLFVFLGEEFRLFNLSSLKKIIFLSVIHNIGSISEFDALNQSLIVFKENICFMKG